jgi:hypothetical protein
MRDARCEMRDAKVRNGEVRMAKCEWRSAKGDLPQCRIRNSQFAIPFMYLRFIFMTND